MGHKSENGEYRKSSKNSRRYIRHWHEYRISVAIILKLFFCRSDEFTDHSNDDGKNKKKRK